MGADDPQLARRVPYRYPSGRAPSAPNSDVGSEAPPPPLGGRTVAGGGCWSRSVRRERKLGSGGVRARFARRSFHFI